MRQCSERLENCTRNLYHVPLVPIAIHIIHCDKDCCHQEARDKYDEKCETQFEVRNLVRQSLRFRELVDRVGIIKHDICYGGEG